MGVKVTLNVADRLGSAGELFDVPRDIRPGGLVWQLDGERVEALSADHARTESGRTIERRKCNIF
jgi:hypothetical protein